MSQSSLCSPSFLVVDRADWVLFPPLANRAAWTGLPVHTREKMLAWGDTALAGYPPRTAGGFLAFQQNGDRQADESPYFERRKRLMGAVLAECVQNEGRYLPAIVDGLWYLCEETSWVISAHHTCPQGEEHALTLPDPSQPEIDLFAAQTAATLAWSLHLLGDALPRYCATLHQRVQRELKRRIVYPFLSRDDFGWMGFVRTDLNNWTPWILSNVIDVLLLTQIEEETMMHGLERALHILDRYLAILPADGGCDEGVAYWNMAGGSLLDCLESICAITGGTFMPYTNPIIRAFGLFPLKAHIAGDWFINFADCDAKPNLDGERIYTYGLRIAEPALAAFGAGLAATQQTAEVRDTPQMNRVLHALFTPMPSPAQAIKEDQTTLLPDVQLWCQQRGRLYTAIKGGHNAENHNHNDVGSILVYADGEPQVVDAGNLRYTAKTFGAERYTLWNTRSGYHNVPIIGGCEQAAGAAYHATDVTLTPAGASMELCHAYPQQACLLHFQRSLQNDGSATLTDTLTLSSPRAVQWVFMLRNKPQVSASGQLQFGNLSMDYPPTLSFAVQEIAITDERMAKSYPGSLWRVLLSAPDALEHHVVFRFTLRP